MVIWVRTDDPNDGSNHRWAQHFDCNFGEESRSRKLGQKGLKPLLCFALLFLNAMMLRNVGLCDGVN